jgi:hypothetical protein
MIAGNSMQVKQSNCRIRLISSHTIDDPANLFSRLMEKCDRGEIKRSFDREWREGAYRFGGDWLTGQAYDLINLEEVAQEDLNGKLQQFETKNVDQCLSKQKNLAFGLYAKGEAKYSPAIPVTTHKCGLVYSGTPIVMVWIDISLDSSLPEAWLDFLSVLKKRESRGYLDHFIDSSGARCSHSSLIFQIEEYFFGSLDPTVIKHSSRNLHRFSRFKILTECVDEATEFLHLTIGNNSTFSHQTKDPSGFKKEHGEADIRWAWGLDAVSGILIQSHNIPAQRGSVQLQNSFNFSDRWLTHVICILQFNLLIALERELGNAVADLPKMRRLRNPFVIFRQIIIMKKNYESMMDGFMDFYWRLGLIQIHSHEKRHDLYQSLRDKLALDVTVSRFNKKLSTLGVFLSEKQKDVIGWILIYIPFVSIMIGLLSINVRGVTADEGLSFGSLLILLFIITTMYVIVVSLTRIFFTSRKSKKI